jgi:segregation and condensation protein B
MDEAARLLEAILFTAGEPMSERMLARRLPAGSDIKRLLARLAADYADRGIHLVRAGETWALMTAPDLGPLLAAERAGERRLSRAAIETLAIIAYHQPVTRAEVEQIRAVQLSKGTLDLLFEHGWIAPKGRRDSPGRPVTWGTTDAFLRHFGLASLRELPDVAELRAAGLLDAGPAAILGLPTADGEDAPAP